MRGNSGPLVVLLAGRGGMVAARCRQAGLIQRPAPAARNFREMATRALPGASYRRARWHRSGAGRAEGSAAPERKSNLMRRVFLVLVIAGLVTGGMAGPALASSHTHHRFSGAAAAAAWHSKVRLSSTRFQLTTWFVGVFTSGGRTFSQVVKEVDKCRMVSGHQRCRVVSFSAGFRNNLTAAQFTVDRKHLQSAHLDASYKLRTFTPHKPVRTSRATVVADWAGTGKISC